MQMYKREMHAKNRTLVRSLEFMKIYLWSTYAYVFNFVEMH